jgi:hypothetical protein
MVYNEEEVLEERKIHTSWHEKYQRASARFATPNIARAG